MPEKIATADPVLLRGMRSLPRVKSQYVDGKPLTMLSDNGTAM
jgi:hypothetical protein